MNHLFLILTYHRFDVAIGKQCYLQPCKLSSRLYHSLNQASADDEVHNEIISKSKNNRNRKSTRKDYYTSSVKGASYHATEFRYIMIMPCSYDCIFA